MYNHEPILSIDIKYKLNKNGNCNINQESFDFATIDAVFSSATKVRALPIDNASVNIKLCP